MDNKAKVATPPSFNMGATTGQGNVNTKNSLPTRTLRGNPNTNLRGAKSVHYNGGTVSIPVNSDPSRPPK